MRSRSAFGRPPAGTASPSWKTRRSLRHSTAPRKWARPFPPSCTRRLRRYWTSCIGRKQVCGIRFKPRGPRPRLRREWGGEMITAPNALMQNSSTNWVVPVVNVTLIFVMIVPVPAVVLDLLLAVSITLGVIVLLSSLYILRPAQFSVFPTLLLFLTLFRISLNIASSRRILLHGNEGAGAAGSVIASFGQFVVGGNYVVGFVLFIALIAIQYLVINHGAVRTAEVAARFTLDALPGKQMAIDADMNAGLIDEHQARTRRETVAREAEFYGAMDGASKFVKGDAIAAIVITFINLFGGFIVGVVQKHMPIGDAISTYSLLSVGDGLVTMIPSLLVSVAGGIVVTRTSSEVTVGVEFGRQLFTRRAPLRS